MSYTKINDKTYFNWVKRIRQAHLAGVGSSTICEMPMLGNNYADIYRKEDWIKCDKCYTKAEEKIWTAELKMGETLKIRVTEEKK